MEIRSVKTNVHYVIISQNLMNEVDVPEGSVFTYRLSNGTHVLIRQSSVDEGKGTEELDCDEDVPLLFLEDGEITYNGIEVTILL
jgi:hypothetical protein